MVSDNYTTTGEERIFKNQKEALFALQMYMNRFIWISTNEIVSGVSSCYYNDLKSDKKNQ
ncbi:MAG: hypothetical protein N3F66_01390 [Spirochaetes bacterium]|nr:hypothetical protein [Spirochaetota bacterium]